MVKLSAEREKLKSSTTALNPVITKIDLRIDNIKKKVMENVRNIVNMSNIGIKELDKRIETVQNELNKLPATERNLINIERKFKINDQIYTFLLQKRAESAIAEASNIPDNKIIDEARSAEKVYPKTTLNYIIAFILGLLIPLIYLFVKDFLNNTII